MLTIYEAAYTGKDFVVQQMLEKDPSLLGSTDEVKCKR
jgi:hypothetical protein